MESPLNNAHQQSRKADMLMKSGKVGEAMICHRRAAEYLLDALQLTSCKQALESIRLQHQYHLKQQDFLQQRHLKQQYNKNNKTVHPQHVNQTTQTDSNLNVVNDIYEEEIQFADEQSHRDDVAYHAMTEAQSVLGFLVNKQNISDIRQKASSEPTVLYTPANQHKSTFMIKFPRDENTVSEELIVQNNELKSTVSQLLKELEDVRKENQQLKEKLLLFENGIGVGKDVFEQCMKDEGDIQLPPIELPPLEMPAFDFQSLNETENMKNSDIFSGE